MLDMMFPAKMYPGGAPDKFLGVGHVINAGLGFGVWGLGFGVLICDVFATQ